MTDFEGLLNQLISLDQQATLAINGSDSLFLDAVAKTATATITWIPVAVVLLYVIIRNNDIRQSILIVLGIGLCIFFSDQIASGICKPMFERYRPAQDPLLMYTIDIVDGYRGGKYGFFSSHAANTFSVALFVSLLIRHKGLTIGIYSWAILNCWTRIYLGVHYLGDITVGIIVGSLIAGIVYFIYEKAKPKVVESSYRSEVQTSTGYPIEFSYQILSILLATYIFILFRGVCL